jgi:hypothetical protein
MAQEDSSWLTTGIEGRKAMAAVCLRACRHSQDIDYTDGLKFNEFSGSVRPYEPAGERRELNLHCDLRVANNGYGPWRQGMISNSKVSKSYSETPARKNLDDSSMIRFNRSI